MSMLSATLHLNLSEDEMVSLDLELPFVPPIGMHIDVEDRPHFIVEEVWWKTSDSVLVIWVREEQVSYPGNIEKARQMYQRTGWR